ncbi:hypothetical protein Tco_1066523 [Tanacetum coccineum]|uniref:Reverse transcriptase domain-containing protein n=1 Tax=Tanacetum coccineum TaxID=301880 RepID=A0ABQ5HBN9_9ASTR
MDPTRTTVILYSRSCKTPAHEHDLGAPIVALSLASEIMLPSANLALDKVIYTPNDISCWVSLLVLPLCLLKTFRPRSNLKCKLAIKRQRQEESIINAIRSLSFPGGSLQVMKETLAESSPPFLDVDEEDIDLAKQNIKQCKRKICDGHYTTAVRVLSSSSVAPYNDATLEDLNTKHPFKPLLSLPHISIDHHHLVASPTVVLDRIKSFPYGTLGEYSASAPLTQLVKLGGGIRPIVVGISRLYFTMCICLPRVFEFAQRSFDVALPSSLEHIFAGLQTKLLQHTGIVSPGLIFDDALSVFNTSMKIDLLSIPLFSVLKPCSRVFAGDIYGDHVVSCAWIIGIKHRHNVVRDTLINICYRSGISAGKEVDIGLDGGRDKPLRMVDFVPGRAMIDVAHRKSEVDVVTLLKQIQKFSIRVRATVHIFNRISFAIAKGVEPKVFARDISGDHAVSCAGIIGIKHRHNVVCDTFIDICYRSRISVGKEVDIRELEEDAVTLLKQIRKFFMTQDIGARVAVHIFNMIGFAIAKGVEAQIAWYLDDGTIVGDTLVVGKVLELIMEDGPRCGLHLNVDKTKLFWPKEDPRSRLEGIFPPNISRPLHGVKLLGGPVCVDVDFGSALVMKRVSKTIGLLDAVAKINDPQCELLLIRACAGVSKLYFAMRTCPPRVFEAAQLSFDMALRSALERIVTASGPGFGDWQWRLATLPFAFGGLGVYSAGDVLNYAFIASRLQSAALQTKLLRHVGLVAYGSTFDDALCVFNASMEIDFLGNPSEIAAPKLMKKMADIYFTRVAKDAESSFSLSPRQMALWLSQREERTSDWLRVVPISGLGQTMNGKTYRCVLCYRLGVPLFSVSKPCSACSKVFIGDVYGDHAVSGAGVIGIKHRHNAVRDTLVDICFRSGISAGKEVDIGLSGDGDKALRPADILLYSWDGGLDVCVDLTGSSPLTRTGMTDFAPGRAVIDAAQRKRGKYLDKCAAIGYGFLPFSFSSLGELEANAVTLLKRIRKFSMVQDIGARAAIHIFNRISFAIAKGVGAQIVSRLPSNLL